jgi:branched-chain amino acid transport system ATP-binding protein
MSLLELENVNSYYGKIHALKGVSLTVERARSSPSSAATARARPRPCARSRGCSTLGQGACWLMGKDITKMAPNLVHKEGLGLVPEGRGIFPRLTVLENLEMGAYIVKDRAEIERGIEHAFSLFPRLRERSQQKGGTLSGGEQQMLATARGLMSNPKILLMDEPSMGLAPVLVDQIFDVIKELNARGTTILLVEQNALMALRLAHRAYVLQTGKIVLSGKAEDVARDENVKKAYLGI